MVIAELKAFETVCKAKIYFKENEALDARAMQYHKHLPKYKSLCLCFETSKWRKPVFLLSHGIDHFHLNTDVRR